MTPTDDDAGDKVSVRLSAESIEALRDGRTLYDDDFVGGDIPVEVRIRPESRHIENDDGKTRDAHLERIADAVETLAATNLELARTVERSTADRGEETRTLSSVETDIADAEAELGYRGMFGRNRDADDIESERSER